MNNQIEPVLDLKIVEKLKSYDPKGEKKLLSTLVDLYLKDAPDLLRDLRVAAQLNDEEKIKFLAHKYKTTNMNLGLKRTYLILEQLEKGSDGIDGRALLIEKLAIEIDLAREELLRLS